MIRWTPLGALLLAASLSGQHAQRPDRLAGRVRCKTPEHAPGKRVPLGPTDCSYNSTDPKDRYAPRSLFSIPVVVHVIKRRDGRGNITPAMVRSQIEILNEDFRALPNTPGANGVDTRIQFHLATKDPNNKPTTGITYSTNDTWFRDRGRYWETLAWDTNRYLNIYTNDADGALGYVPEIPQSGSLVGTKSDRVVVLWSSFGRNGPIGPPYDMGRTATHEVGHYLGLLHTFSRQCDSSSTCNRAGDLICDTNPHRNPTDGCSDRRQCNSPDPIRNYLNYSDDRCMQGFTQQQARRMRCTLEHWRTRLATQCAVAAATSRTAGTNVDTYSSTRPILGETFVATVDVRRTGHKWAFMFGYSKPAQLAIGGGQFLLLDLTAAPVLALPAAAGPIARFRLPLPTAPSLCGAKLSTQAIHAGGLPGIALTNARDLTLGTR